MSRNWDALVMNDYEAVMPLPWNKKYGLRYLYQPNFVRHTGIFGNNTGDEITDAFFSSIPKHFKYWDIDLKEDIDPGRTYLKGLVIKKRRNLFLDISRKYEEISKDYKRLAKRMLVKANENKIEISGDGSVEEVIGFYKKNYSHQQNISDTDYANLAKIAGILLNEGKAAAYLAKSPEGATVAIYLVLKDKKFIYSLLGGSNKKGKETGAFYLLTDTVIKEHSTSERIFRFEGSDKKGIALFNSQFSPAAVDYYHLKMNKLPWPAKLLK